MSPTVPRSWQAPPASASEEYKLGFLNSSAEEGFYWHKAQRAYRDWQNALDIISGDEGFNYTLDYRSHLSGHRLKTNIRVAVAGLANIRPIWGWHAPKAYAGTATMLNKSARAMYLNGYWDQDIKTALVWASLTGTGFARPVYRRDMAGRGKGSIEIDSYGMPSVCPVQMPSNGDFQRAYSVTLLDEMPIWMAHGMFPTFQDKLKPTQSRYWYSAEIRKAASKNLLSRSAKWFSRKESDFLSDVYIPIRYTTINDLSINTTGYTIPMGQTHSSWYYEVPSLGEEIPDGNGGIRKADENDARLYPFRRLMISSQNCCIYDGPSFNWHGQLDLIPFQLDSWPFEPMGFSLVHDGWELSKALDDIDRGCMEKVRADLDRPLAYNIDAVAKREAAAFDPLEPRTRIGFDGSQADKPFTSPVEESFFEIRQTSLAVREIFQSELDYILQTRDIVELSKARALGKGMDQLEALIAANGPLVRDMSRSMEKPVGMLGHQIGYLILQYKDTAELMQWVGPEGIDSEIFDFDPNSIIPSHMPGERVSEEGTEKPIPSQYTRIQRAKWFAQNLKFFILPHSLHEMTQMSHRLLLLQLKQRGLPISDATVMSASEVADIQIPDGNTEQDRWKAEQEEKIVFAARMKEVVQGLGIDPETMTGGKKPSGTTHAGGRPPSAQAAPQMAQRDGGSRTIIKESR